MHVVVHPLFCSIRFFAYTTQTLHMCLPVPLEKNCLTSVSGVPQKLHFGTGALKGMIVAVPFVLSVICYPYRTVCLQWLTTRHAVPVCRAIV